MVFEKACFDTQKFINDTPVGFLNIYIKAINGFWRSTTYRVHLHWYHKKEIIGYLFANLHDIR